MKNFQKVAPTKLRPPWRVTTGLGTGLCLAARRPDQSPETGISTPGGTLIPAGSRYRRRLMTPPVPYPSDTGTRYCCSGHPVQLYCGSKRARLLDYCSNCRRAAVRLCSLVP